MITRRQFIGGCLGAAALGVGALGYATGAEPFWVQVVERPLPVRRLPPALAGARLIQLSDLHVGDRVPDSYVLEQFERVRALQPDILVVTGDLTQSGSANHAERVYARMPQGRLATICILGNHDYGVGWSDLDRADRIASVMRGLGVTVLRNDSVEVGGFQIIGMDDLWARRFNPGEAFATVDLGGPVLCLSHNPDTADMDGWNGYSGWILAGHTHGGQCRPPFLPPPLLPVENRRYTSGEFELPSGRHMYINRGLGFLHQVRFNARPEITVFELQIA